jgi:thiamine pyrophosphate-dependent acetolactate synthase large subunit-like protein
MAALVQDRDDDLLVVPGLGSTTWDLAAAGDNPRNFYLWGAMGGAAMIGLGLALAQPKRRVAVITGDGEMLMGLGALATIAAAAPPNLAIAVLDNARFGETGSQRSHTAVSTDLEAVARACGWRNTATVRSMEEAEALAPRLRRESLFAVARISPEEKPRVLPPRDGALLASRFRQAIGVAAG